MNAPIREFVQRYAASGTARLHMPGHKGIGPLGCEALDITEVAGADALYEASGIIAESEANAVALFGTRRTLYSTEGSSHCIRAMLQLAMCVWQEEHSPFVPAADSGCQSLMHSSKSQTSVYNDVPPALTVKWSAPDGRDIPSNMQTSVCTNPRPVALAGRNAHRAFLTAAALCDFDVEWLWPEAEVDSPCACPVTAEGLTRKLDAMECAPFCVYVTSPDYLGGMLDIAALGEVCHARGVPLLVDNAHGAYQRFLPEQLHPMELGADLCCDSVHKTLPVLTGGAYLHVGRDADARYAERAKQALALFGSTSPSYLVLQSLDCANVELAGEFPAKLAECRARVDELKSLLTRRGFEILPSEPMKLALRTDGPKAASLLRANGVEPELVEPEHVVLMFSPSNAPEDFERIERALPSPLPFTPAPALSFPPPPRACSIREAMFAPCVSVAVERALGRVCAVPTASCPPAVAVAVPGEIVTEEVIRALQQCDIRELAVIKA